LLWSLPLLLISALQLNAASYYVDYAAGNDGNIGTATTAAWKHCPGDPAASGSPAAVSLTAGDTVYFKGGVTFVLTGASGIALRWNGAQGTPISYDGNSAGTWGSGRAIVTDNHGGSSVTAFSASTASSWLTFKSLEFSALGGSATLPADSGSAASPRFGGGIAFTAGASNTAIDGCVFRNLGYAFNQKPMAASSLAGTAISLASASSVSINNCDFSALTTGIDAGNATSLTNFTITNCAFHDSVVWPFNVPNSNTGIVVSGCTETNNAQFDRSAWTGYGENPRASSQSVAAGSTVTLSASALATPSATFQWQKNGQTIATGATLTLASVTSSDVGTYTVTATNSVGSKLSHEVVLAVTGGSTAVGTAPIITTQPISQTAAPNSTVTFTVAASGSPTPTYQWFRNGVTFSGWTGPSLTIAGVSSNDAGTYTAVATNSAGSVSSNAATLTISADSGPTVVAPTITTQPNSQTVVELSSVSFTVAASGTPTPTLQWFKNGVAISGATNTTFTISNASLNDAGSYTVVATNSAGSATSNAATLTVTSAASTNAPMITTQPISQTVAANSTVTFTVAASGSPAPTYQWFRNGITFSGWTGASLTVSGVTSNDVGTYVAVATNSSGSATSNGATLTLGTSTDPVPTTTPPMITTQPSSQTITEGSSVSFTVAASGTPAPTLQWFKNGTAISGATATTFTIASASLNDAGTYTAVATNSVGSATSSGATLTVNAKGSTTVAPVFTLQPVSVTAAMKTKVTFSAAASGTPTPTYQWKKDGTAIAGATSSTFAVTVNKGSAGTYTVVASNVAGSVTSNPAVLTVSNIKAASASGSDDVTPVSDTSASASTSRLVNLSVRATAGTGDDSLIVGFVVSGDSSKSLLIRGSGPALNSFGLTGTLADPTLALYAGSNLLAANDDWQASSDATDIQAASAQAGAFTLSDSSRDAALLTSVGAGAYTGQVSGKDATSGTALIELYDTAPNADARLVNVSVRTVVKSDGGSPVIGFVVTGNEPKKLLIRAVGPALASFGVANTLADPQLEIYQGSTRVEQNDNWSGSTELNDAFGRTGAFPLSDSASKDAALVFTAAPGAYTAVVSGANNTSGTVLVEVYEMP
jgi:hypothetical protein